jgi:hypothetical protein
VVTTSAGYPALVVSTNAAVLSGKIRVYLSGFLTDLED